MMKKLLKVFMYIIISILSLIIILTVIAKLAQNSIADVAMEYVSEAIETPMSVDEVSFHLLHKFPLATIQFNGVWLGSPNLKSNNDSISSESDTLVFINKIYFSVKSKPLLDGEFEIIKVDIEGADFNYMVDEKGVTNFDFLMDTTQVVESDTTPSAPLNLILKELSLKNISLNYSDSSTMTNAKLFIPEIKIKGKAKNDKYAGSIKGGIKLSETSFEGTNLHLMNQTELKFDLDYVEDSVSIDDFTIITDGANLNVTGYAIVKDTITTDIRIKGSDINIGELFKYAPSEILKEFGVKRAAGIINIDATVKGDVYDEELPQVLLNINMKNGLVATTEYPAIKNLSFNGTLTNGILRNNQTSSAVFNNFHIEIENSKIDADFSVLDIDHPNYSVNTSMQINLSDFKEFIPDTLLKDIDGQINAKFSTKGKLPDNIGDDFTDYILERSKLSLGLKNININVDDTLLVQNFSAQFSYVPKRIKIEKLAVKVPSYDIDFKETALDVIITGKTTDMKTLGVDIRKYRIQTGSNVVEGNATIYNIDAPEYTINTSMHLDLPELMPFVPDSMINSMTGIFDAEMHSHGKINMDSIDEQSMALVFENSRFNFKATDITLDMVDTLSNIDSFSMDFAMANDIINIDNVYGSYNGLEFWMDSTEILNVYETIIKEKRDTQLIVQTNVRLGDISNAFLYPFLYTETTSADVVVMESDMMRSADETQNNENADKKESGDEANSDTDEEELPSLLPNFEELGVPHFLIRGKFAVGNLEYEKNVLDDISLKFRFTDSLYVIDQMKFKFCGGDMNTSVKFDARKWEKPVVDVRNKINNLNIKKLLIDNDNFGDTALTHEKVGGILSSNLDFRGFFIGDSMPTNKIRVKGHMNIIDGKIYDYAPLVDLSTSIGGLKELDKMDFNTLNTDIFVYKDKIYVPKTDIVSSALDISVFAMQSFQDDFEYHLVLHLSDVLTGKSDKLMEKQAKQNKKDGGTVERNGINLVSMQIGDDKKNGFDNEKLKQKFKNKLNMQQGFLNLLFNPMLVNFSTDIDRTARNREILEKYEREKKKD